MQAVFCIILDTDLRGVNMTLKDLEIGKTARIVSVGGEGALRQHLDVYKRQGEALVNYLADSCCHAYRGIRLKDISSHVDAACTFGNGSVSHVESLHFRPVSYTHLDVYKRQVPCCGWA